MNNIQLSSINNKISYTDSNDHFENAVLRLLNIDVHQFQNWLNYAEEYDGDIINQLKHGFSKIKPPIISENKKSGHGPNAEAGSLWYQLTDKYYVVKSIDSSIAWLSKEENNYLLRETSPPLYEKEYFEGNPSIDGGYGEYIKQASWRLEKADRQLQQIIQTTGLSSGRALDIGSGYGYFRNALEKNNFSHDGIEISEHARTVAKEIYNQTSFPLMLDEYVKDFAGKYDLITMWDVIEHVANPIFFLQDTAKCLKSGGVLALKTPNINCPEVEIFGSHYHSFKREHLVYFSQNSLVKLADLAGFIPCKITSTSHLLKGFIGDNECDKLSNECQGSDLVAYFIKK